MRAHIVCYEQPPSWILGKIAHKLCNTLKTLSIDSTISDQPDFNADVNHHIYYLPFKGHKTKIDTLLVTHIDKQEKLRILLGQLAVADGAIFFSEQTRNMLQIAGAPTNKLTVINPPQDEVIKPRKMRVGILTNIYPNYRKREDLIYDLVSSVNLSGFEFIIMGTGWENLAQTVPDWLVYVTWPLFSQVAPETFCTGAVCVCFFDTCGFRNTQIRWDQPGQYYAWQAWIHGLIPTDCCPRMTCEARTQGTYLMFWGMTSVWRCPWQTMDPAKYV